jgi:gamma-glutamyltranspeptidase/glutathione hydrolase
MVACPHALASQAGVDASARGRLGRSTPRSPQARARGAVPAHDGVGGDAFWLIYDAKKRKRCAISTAAAGAAASASIAGFASGPQRDPVSRHPARDADHARRASPAGWKRTATTAGCRSSAISKPPSAMRARALPSAERLAGWIEASAAELAPHP